VFHGREPSLEQIIETTGLPRTQIESLIAIEQMPRALQEPVVGGQVAGNAVEDFVADPAAEDDYELVLRRSESDYVRDLTEGRASENAMSCAPATGSDGRRRRSRGESPVGSA
jgi:DNA-directed RNA polymerase sigma subunit (sigma70/sigma32)